jgi:hypothetical protein
LGGGLTGIIPVIPPDAALSAASKIRPEDRGKVPGRLNGQGTWSGFDWLRHQTSEQDLAAWARMGAGGYGDPRERDPARLAEDARSGLMSTDYLERHYCYRPDSDS